MPLASHVSAHELIDQRLDALDRALLGLLPRSERLAVVSDVEARILCAHAANPAVVVEATEVDQPASAVAAPVTRRPAGRRRSRLALTSGVLGIVALALLFVSPITYFVVVATSEMFGEIFSYSVLGINVLLVAVGGAAAVILGITALVRLGRRQQVGHGWAITGLCTGPLPTLVGGLGMLTFGLPLLMELAMESGPSLMPAISVAETTYAPGKVPPATLPPEAKAAVWNASAGAPIPSSNSVGAKCMPATADGYAEAPLLPEPPQDLVPSLDTAPTQGLPVEDFGPGSTY